MSKGHTPGPWRKCGGYTADYIAVSSNDGYIVYGMADHDSQTELGKPIEAPDYPTQQANARLIAAAPDLLNALQDMLGGWQYIRQFHGDLYGVGWDRAETKAMEAIKKATGAKQPSPNA